MTEQSTQPQDYPSAAPDRIYQFGAFATLIMLFLYSGFCLQALPVVAPSILEEWNIPARDIATPLALTAVGMGLGAVLGGYLGDARGRKFPIIGFAGLQGLAMFFCSFATDLTGLYALIFINGLGLGGYFSSGMALMTELAPEDKKGLMISFAILAGPLGLGICSLVGSVVAPAYGWASIFLIGGVAAVPLVAALALFVPESPRYLRRMPERAELRQKILTRLGLPEEEEVLEAPEERPGMHLVGTLLRERLGTTLLLWIVFFVMYVLGSSVLGWVPVVLSSLDFDLAFAARSLFFWTLGSMIGTPLSGWFIGRIGAHKTGLMFSAIAVAAISLLTFADLSPQSGNLILILLPCAGFAVAGVVTTLYTLAAESYPTAMRATGIGLADAVGRIGGILGAYSGVIAMEQAGAFGFFFVILCLAAVTVAVLFLLWLGHRKTA